MGSRVAAAVLCVVLFGLQLLAPALAESVRLQRLEPTPAADTIDDVRALASGWSEAGDALRPPSGSRWWRVEFDPAAQAAEGDWVLALREAYDARLVAYLPPLYEPLPLHTFDPTLDQVGSRHRLTLLLTKAQRAQPVYLQIDWSRSQPISLSALPLTDYIARDLNQVRFTSATVAAKLLLALVGAVYAFALRRRALLMFCGWILSTAIYQAVLSGEIAWLMGDSMRVLPPMAVAGLFINLGLLSAYAFVYSFLNLRAAFPRLSRIYRGLMWVAVGVLVLMTASSAAPMVAHVFNLLVLVLALLALGIALRLSLRGDVQALIYLFGWGAVACAGMLRAGYFIQQLGTPLWLEYAHHSLNAFGALVVVLAVARAARYAEREMHSARLSARTDPLTGLPNRAELDSGLPGRIAQARAQGLPLSLLFIDLDHFKRINDTYGHDTGDLCLIAAAAALRRHVRASDLLARYGGEEFVLVLKGAGACAAHEIGEALRAGVERECRALAGHAVGLTVSVGIAELRVEESAGELLQRADAALYRAKAAGRNRVVRVANDLDTD